MKLQVLNSLGKLFTIDFEDESTLELLRMAVASALSLPLASSPEELARLKLVKSGLALVDDASVKLLKDGDTLLAAVAPRPPPQKIRDFINGEREPEDEAELLLKIQLPPTASQFQKGLVLFFKDTLHIPEPILALIIRIGWKIWLSLTAWMMIARIAADYELGPPLIVGTCFALIAIVGFSQRTEGSLSAYSIFNPNLQRLPGQLTAEHMDGQVRRGQM
ncbi:hypothetical protein Ndes2526B_g07290 [Nannochloris sp. 'desiccata']